MGEFIIEIVKRLKESSLVYGFNVQVAFQLCVYGYDIVAEKIERCKQRLEALVFDQTAYLRHHYHVCSRVSYHGAAFRYSNVWC